MEEQKSGSSSGKMSAREEQAESQQEQSRNHTNLSSPMSADRVSDTRKVAIATSPIGNDQSDDTRKSTITKLRSSLARSKEPTTGKLKKRNVHFAEETTKEHPGEERPKTPPASQARGRVGRAQEKVKGAGIKGSELEENSDSEQSTQEQRPAVERGRTMHRAPRRENESEDSDSWKRRGRSPGPRKPTALCG